MPLLLDTSIAVDLLKGEPVVLGRRDSYNEEAFLSVVSRVELEAGVYRNGSLDQRLRKRLDHFLEEVEELPFTSREVTAYSSILAAKGFSRRLVVDRMIAATAIANELTLATLNPRDFRDIPGLRIEDWSN